MMDHEALRIRINEALNRIEVLNEELLSLKFSLEGLLNALPSSEASAQRRGEREEPQPSLSPHVAGEGSDCVTDPLPRPATHSHDIVEEFPMPNPDALNRGPLRWLLRKLEEEDQKGHMRVWHAIDGDKVRFMIKFREEATPEDRKKLNRWLDWTRKALTEGKGR